MITQDTIRDEINVLIVDDIIANLTVLAEMIKKAGFMARPVTSVIQALEAIEIYEPQLILLDISMPDMDGFDLCEMLKSSTKTRDIPIIFISAMNSTVDKVKGFKLGAVDFITKPFELDEVILRVSTHIKIYRMQHELESYNNKLQRLLSEQHNTMMMEYRNMFLTMAKLAEAREKTDELHFINIAKKCRILAMSLQLSDYFEDKISDEFINLIELAAPLHDIGKITLPDNVLCKKDQLTEEEMDIIKKHPRNGSEILKSVNKLKEHSDLFELAAEIANFHHEKWDGSGYPEGLKGEEIPISARIMAIVDSYEALTSKTCYHEPYSHEESMKIIIDEAGKSFDPEIVEIFTKIQKQIIGDKSL